MSRWLIPLILSLGACSGVGLVAIAADPFSHGRTRSPVAEDVVDRELDRFRGELARLRGPSGGVDSSDHYLFADVLNQVLIRYVRPMEPRRLVDEALNGVRDELKQRPNAKERPLIEAALGQMLASLDPYSSYLSPEDFNDLQAHTRGEFGGLGLELTFDNDQQLVKVVSPIDHTPAEMAGIRAGDLITHLDGVSIKGVSLHDAVGRMRGAPGTRIRLTIQRGAAAQLMTFDITRAVIKVDPVRHRLVEGSGGPVGYLRVTAFNEQTAEDLDHALTELFAHARGPITGIVLDLRNNPGGLLDEAVDVASRFLKPGFNVVSVRGRSAGGDRTYRAQGRDEVTGLPVVVLINGGSASAAEIVASALQDHRRALLFGTRSYGKGSVQTVAPMGSGDALRLTTALYYRPSGALVDCYGVTPNVEIWSPPSTGPDSEPHQDRARCAVDAPAPTLPTKHEAAALCPRVARTPIVPGEEPPGPDKNDRVIECAVEALRETLEARR